jgi:tetratricopeptide (TPR) repeat protein
LASIANDARNILNIYTNIGDFLEIMQDIKSVSYDELTSTNYKSLLEKVGFEANDLPVELFQILSIDKAEEQDIAINKFIKSHPSYYLGYFTLGGIEFERENFRKASESYTQAIKLNSKDEKLFNDRGNTYYKLRDYWQAIKDYDKAIEMNPNDASFYFGRGNALDELGKYDKAINEYNNAIKLNPQDDMFYNNRGSVFVKLEQFEEALKDYEKALELNPSNKLAHLNRGWLVKELNNKRNIE